MTALTQAALQCGEQVCMSTAYVCMLCARGSRCEAMISRLTSMLGANARVGDAASTRAVCRTDCQELANHVHLAQIWRRGLLLKGNGLCHGVAGSGYALLSLYKHTRDPVHLERCVAVTVGHYA